MFEHLPNPRCKKCNKPMTWYWWAPGSCEWLCDHCTGPPVKI